LILSIAMISTCVGCANSENSENVVIIDSETVSTVKDSEKLEEVKEKYLALWNDYLSSEDDFDFNTYCELIPSGLKDTLTEEELYSLFTFQLISRSGSVEYESTQSSESESEKSVSEICEEKSETKKTFNSYGVKYIKDVETGYIIEFELTSGMSKQLDVNFVNIDSNWYVMDTMAINFAESLTSSDNE
ncbi:MAG: hypothetical protein LUG94_00445, partial [Ruminococcus sp.]|nr:hypothetical protein [Ruminococcus sp.]